MKTLSLKKIDPLLGRLLARYLPAPRSQPVDRPESLLLIRPGGIGDAVLLIPLIRTLKQRWPDCHIDVLAEERNAAVFQLCPLVGRVYRYDRVQELLLLMRQTYTVVIETEQWHCLSTVVGRLIASQRKIGFATNRRERLLTDAVPYAQKDYEVDSFLHLLEPLGVEPVPISGAFLQPGPKAQQRAEELLSQQQRELVALFPGASIAERRWPVERFAQLAGHLLAGGYQPLVVGGDQDCAAAAQICAAGGLNFAGRTRLEETAAILQRCRLLISGDSGVLHLGVGLDLTTLSLFGPGIADKWAPHGECHRVINHQLPCSPCTRFGTTPPCPIGARCIHEIQVNEVWAAAQALLTPPSQ